MNEEARSPEPLPAIRESYDRLARDYADRLSSELQNKPADRALLTRFASRVKDQGQACDLGCGPGQVARYLHDAGIDIFGVDLSPGMIEEARRLHPQIPFRLDNMLALDLPGGSLAGIVAFYAIVNLPAAALPQAFREMARVLRPGGLLLAAFHVGDETLAVDHLWGHPITMNFHLFLPSTICTHIQAAGLVVEDVIERAPYAPEVEHQSRRAYIFARKPQ